MPGPGLYADFDKSTKDLLTKDFPEKCYKVEFVTKAANNCEFTTSVEKGDAMKASFSPKYSCDCLNGMTIKPTIESPSLVKLEVTNNEIVKGLKTVTSVSGGSAFGGNLAVEFQNEKAAVKSSLAYKEAAPLVLESSIALLYKKFFVGGAVTVSGIGKENELKACEAGAFYKDTTYSCGATFKTTGNNNSLFASYWHKVRPTTEVGAKVGYDLSSDRLADSVDVTVGTKHVVNDTVALKAKLGTCGRVSGSLSQKLSDAVTLILGGSTNCCSNSGNDSKVGLSLSYKN